MKLLLSISVAALFVSGCCTQKTLTEEGVSTYYLIRHAEKDRSDESDRDPELTEEGRRRAENWATHFKDIHFDAVFSSDTERTRATAGPTAKANDLELQIHDPTVIDITEFMMKTKGQTVLIVGHSNTTPMLADRLYGEHNLSDIPDDNYSNLYIVTVADGSKSVLLTTVPSSIGDDVTE